MYACLITQNVGIKGLPHYRVAFVALPSNTMRISCIIKQ